MFENIKPDTPATISHGDIYAKFSEVGAIVDEIGNILGNYEVPLPYHEEYLKCFEENFKKFSSQKEEYFEEIYISLNSLLERLSSNKESIVNECMPYQYAYLTFVEKTLNIEREYNPKVNEDKVLNDIKIYANQYADLFCVLIRQELEREKYENKSFYDIYLENALAEDFISNVSNNYVLNDLINEVLEHKELKNIITEYVNIKHPPKRTNRTRRKAEEAGTLIDNHIDYLAFPSTKDYENAFSFTQKGKAYLKQLPPSEGPLKFQDGRIYDTKNNQIFSDIIDLNTGEKVQLINAPLLKYIFTKLLKSTDEKNYRISNEKYTFYIPDIINELGYSNYNSNKQAEFLISKLNEFKNIIGIIIKSDGVYKYPVVSWNEVSERNNTITISSDYLNNLILAIYTDSIRKDKHNKPITDNEGNPKLKPSYQYHIKPSICIEKNQIAIRNVEIISNIVTQAGKKNTAHVSLEYLIRENELFHDALSKPNCRKTQTIKRVMKNTFEYLIRQTDFSTLGIIIPDPEKFVYPTYSDIKYVFEFPRKKTEENPTIEQS